jgi:antitoxin VapB
MVELPRHKEHRGGDAGLRAGCRIGESITSAVAVAVRERSERARGHQAAIVTETTARIKEIARDAGGRWVEPYRSTDHGELLNDESGLPA